MSEEIAKTGRLDARAVCGGLTEGNEWLCGADGTSAPRDVARALGLDLSDAALDQFS